jgi:hypothetical protein
MITTEIIQDASGTIDLIRTFSTENFKLLQNETGIVYGWEVIDAIVGYDENEHPYGRYTYTETNEKDTDIEFDDELTETKAALGVLGVTND